MHTCMPFMSSVAQQVAQEHESAALEFLVLPLLVKRTVAADQAYEIRVAQLRVRVGRQQGRRGAEFRKAAHETL